MDLSMGLPQQDDICFFPLLPPASYNQSPKSHGAKRDWGGGGAVVPGTGFGFVSHVRGCPGCLPPAVPLLGSQPAGPGTLSAGGLVGARQLLSQHERVQGAFSRRLCASVYPFKITCSQ